MIKRLLLSLALVALALPAAAADPGSIEIVFPQDATVTHFTDSWGAARAGHRHQGNDLMAPKMTPVVAAADGVVSWIRDSGTAGRYVAIEHEGGWETWYMHLNDDNVGTDDGAAPVELGIAVVAGEEVETGQVIGWVGDSGNAEGASPHTHFELHINGQAVDPHSYLVKAFDEALVAEKTEPTASFILR